MCHFLSLRVRGHACVRHLPNEGAFLGHRVQLGVRHVDEDTVTEQTIE